MMSVNKITQDNVEYYVEYVWRESKDDKTTDSKGKRFPFPEEGQLFGDKDNIIRQLTLAHRILTDMKDYVRYEKPIDCHICGKRAVDKKKFVFMDRMWGDGIIHYIKAHNVEPSVQFKNFIYNQLMGMLESKLAKSIKTGVFCVPDPDKDNKDNNNDKARAGSMQRLKNVKCKKLKRIKKGMILQRVMINNEEYVKLEKNKLLILDALMISGGRFKKYVDPYNENVKRYSEHAGFLDFDSGRLQKIVVSGQTDRIDEGDDEIFLPKDMDEMFDYEYIFHTHPPTPKPGGRASIGILYELPSMGDIFHFIDHYNEGNVIGSLVIAAEGLYNIRRYIDKEEELKKLGTDDKLSRTDTDDYDELIIDESELYEEYRKIFKRIQKDAINQYGTEFNLHTFYSEIAQDTSFIDRFNRILNRYQINIDYYPRKKDGKYWYIDTVFLKFRYYYEAEDSK
jgi:hypothetical protein